MQQLSKEEIQNILTLISKASITGVEAMVVAQLQQKLLGMLNVVSEEKPKTK